MELVVRPAKTLNGTVSVPPSKSYTHRAIILASLARGTSMIYNPLYSEDTLASIEACKRIGAEIITGKDNDLQIKGVFGRPQNPKDEIDVKNSGTTLRIMTPVCSLCNEEVFLTGDESIRKRPMQPLLDALEQLGVSTTSNNGLPPVSVRGPLGGGKCMIRGDVSSQFISGLLIASPLAAGETDIKVLTDLKSRPYVDLTLDIIEKFKGSVEKCQDSFRIPGEQIYESTNYVIEGDYSSAAIMLAAAALTDSEVSIDNLQLESKQGDRKIIDILRFMGANLRAEGNTITLTGSGDLDGIETDLSDTPDIVPAVAVLGSLAKGKTLIKNVGHLRFKESDRLKAMTTELKKMGAKIKEGKDSLEIHGVDALKGAKLHGWNDHRIVMCLAVAALRAEGESTIDGAESIPVSFPGFVEKMQGLGADMTIKT